MDVAGHRSEIWREQMRRMAVVRVSALEPNIIFVAGDDAAVDSEGGSELVETDDRDAAIV